MTDKTFYKLKLDFKSKLTGLVVSFCLDSKIIINKLQIAKHTKATVVICEFTNSSEKH